jgi:2-dehydropantoate 2-reductase
MIAFDPKAKSSTLQDLERGRRTETGEFQGAIIRLAEQAGMPTPLTRLVLDRIEAAEAEGKGSPHLSPDELAPA